MLTELSGRQKAIVMGSVMLGLFVSAMDQTVVSTATPRVVAELGGLSKYSWLFTSYMLTSTTLVPVVGKLGDMYGRKPLFMGGIALFMLASVLSGAAQTIDQLIVFRGIQGIGAGLIMANSFTIIGDLFTPAERGKYQGLFSAVFGLASILGPFIGGYLTDNLSWRWVFYVNIPIGLAALPALWFGLPFHRAAGVRRKLDLAGTITLIAATVPLLLACVWVGERRYALTSPATSGMVGFSVAMIALFIRVELRAAEPIVPMSLFRNRVFSIGTLIIFMTGVAMFGVISFVPLFVQGSLGKSATRSGSVTMPMMIAMVIASIIGGQLVSRTGRYKWQAVVGMVLVALGVFLLARMTVETSVLQVSLNIILVGLGMGMSMPVLGVAMQNAVPYRLLGVSTAASQFFRQMGGTLGVAILGAAMTARLHGEIARTLPPEVAQRATPAMLARIEDAQTMLNPAVLNQLHQSFLGLGPDGAALYERALETMRAALASALQGMFLAGAVVMLAAVAISFFPARGAAAAHAAGGGGGAPPGRARRARGATAAGRRPLSERRSVSSTPRHMVAGVEPSHWDDPPSKEWRAWH
jgi:EmrB/QacA subfamily drug resistance transporter